MKEPWNWSSFIRVGLDYATFRILGFGVLMYSIHCEMAEIFDRKVWAVPILPGVRFAFVAPWI